MTLLILGAMVSVWLLVQGGGFDQRVLAMSVCNLGLVPGELTGQAPLGSGVTIARGLACVVDDEPINWLTPVLSIFLHGGWAHLLGNGLFLWVFGNNIEDVMGRGRFLVFFLLCGVAAATVHVLVDPASIIPTVGASGAVSGIMGAYLVLYPQVRVRMLFIFVIFFKVIPLPAWVVLLWWLGLQILMGLPQLAQSGELTGGVAFWAHVGGFATGVLLIGAFEDPEMVERRRAILLRRGVLADGTGRP
jgi:membrane associated rhomboid family serine protease